MPVRPGASGWFSVRKGSSGPYYKLRFVSETSFTSVPASSTTETYLDPDLGDVTTPGSPGKPNWSVTVSVNDAALAYRHIRYAFENKTTLSFEEITGEADQVTNGSSGMAIAAGTGTLVGSTILTGSGSALDNGKLIAAITAGRLVVMDAKAYNVEERLTDTTARMTYAGPVTDGNINGQAVKIVSVVDDPSTAVPLPTAGAWELHDFQAVTTWAGKVTDAGGTSRSGTTRNETVQGSCDDFPSKTLVLGSSA